jgi:hypothetical protein
VPFILRVEKDVEGRIWIFEMGKNEEVDFPRYRLVQLSARPEIWSFVFVVLICC